MIFINCNFEIIQFLTCFNYLKTSPKEVLKQKSILSSICKSEIRSQSNCYKQVAHILCDSFDVERKCALHTCIEI